jgi:hypothetical protein
VDVFIFIIELFDELTWGVGRRFWTPDTDDGLSLFGRFVRICHADVDLNRSGTIYYRDWHYTFLSLLIPRSFTRRRMFLFSLRRGVLRSLHAD